MRRMSKKRDRALTFCENFSRALPESLSHLSPAQRIEFFSTITATYCPHCGRKKRVSP